MVQKIEELLIVDVMASAGSSSSPGRRKTQDYSADSVEVEEAADDVIEIPKLNLAPVRTSNLKLTCGTDTIKTQKKDEDEQSGYETPKSEEHKIFPASFCPPAPRKPKSTPSGRNPANCHSFPSDSPELNFLFSPDLNADDHRHKKKRRRKRERSLKNIISKAKEQGGKT